LGNIETFEMDKYYKLFPDPLKFLFLSSKHGGTINDLNHTPDTIKEF
jgi:hypothetical protein